MYPDKLVVLVPEITAGETINMKTERRGWVPKKCF